MTRRHEALDLGAGALNDAAAILEAGFDRLVTVDKVAVDPEIVATFPSDRLEYVIESFESYEFPVGRFDLVNAQYSLPFIRPERFDEVFARVVDSIADQGVIVGQFFGDRDEWSSSPVMTFHTKERAEATLVGLDVIEFKEEERDKPTAKGDMKHWHVFHFIARNGRRS